MANRYETGQNIERRETSVRGTPVHDMPDFTAALENYKEILEGLQVPPQDAERAVDVTIENVTTTSHKRRSGNGFINLVHSLSRGVGSKNSQPPVTPQRK